MTAPVPSQFGPSRPLTATAAPIRKAEEVWASSALPRGGVPLRPDFRQPRTAEEVQQEYDAMRAGAAPRGDVNRRAHSAVDAGLVAAHQAAGQPIAGEAMAEVLARMDAQDKRLDRQDRELRRLREEFAAQASYPGAA
jgi:hypothetical protein